MGAGPCRWRRLQKFCTATALNRISFQKLADSINKAILRALVRLRLDVLHSNSRISSDPGFISNTNQGAPGLHIVTRAFVFIAGQCLAVDSSPHRPVGDTGPLEHLPTAPAPPHQPSVVRASERHAAPERDWPSPVPSHSAAPGNVHCSPEQHAVSTASSIAATAHQRRHRAVPVYPWNNSSGSSIPDPALFPACTKIAGPELNIARRESSILFNIAHPSRPGRLAGARRVDHSVRKMSAETGARKRVR